MTTIIKAIDETNTSKKVDDAYKDDDSDVITLNMTPQAPDCRKKNKKHSILKL